ncbi:Alpha/Beta hydrolase protein [Podospora australis]|uniref:Alpha/Beta hydrolase protein n=1 Tax=Podospora australis TaxID=1536484 RepID=A0AAN7AEB6_9PEZI|nr:Alpha/Beta hydrolase protein [Podospora australis]
MQAPFCRDCFTGTLRGDVTPQGTVETLHGLPTYVSRPPDGVTPLETVVLITDALGWELLNTRALADAYARRVPCTVFVPDILKGHALPLTFLTATDALDHPPNGTPPSFLTKVLTYLKLIPGLLTFLFHNHKRAAHPRVLSFFRSLRESSPPNAKIGAAGFCWGGLHTVLLTHASSPEYTYATPQGSAKPLIDCAFTAHPSLLTIPRDIERAVQPLSVANGDDDQFMGRQKMEVLVRVLRGKNTDGQEERYEAVVYPGAKHGFAVRGDIGDPLQRERGEGSEEQAVRWFRRWFTSSS